MTHDKDRCPVCIDDRAYRLRRRGLCHGLVQRLRWAGGVEQVKVIESASDEQIASLNRAYAEYAAR